MFVPISDVLRSHHENMRPSGDRERNQLQHHKTGASRTPSHTSRTHSTSIHANDVRDVPPLSDDEEIYVDGEPADLDYMPPAWVIGHYTDVRSFGRHSANMYEDV